MWARRPPFAKLLISFSSLLLQITTPVCRAQDQSSTALPELSPYSTATPLFLRPGSSYLGKTASTRIANVASSIAVLVAIDNWTRFPLIEPKTDLQCGKVSDAGEDIPEEIVPGISEMILLEKGPGFTGICAVITYQLGLPEEEPPKYVQLMMSIPYNLNSYSSYLAVGIADMYLNSTELFNQMYYYSGPFERAQAGNLVEFTPEGGKLMVRGMMTPDTYKPIFRVSVIPLDKQADGFQAYSSKSRLRLKWSVTLSLPLFTLIYTWAHSWPKFLKRILK